jgi:hypothetical protein
MDISDIDKKIYIDLLNTLYINSAAIGPVPKNILPNMLIWKGDQTLLNWDEDES